MGDESDAAEIVAEVQRLNSALPEGAQVPDLEAKAGTIRLLSYTSRGQVPSLCSAMGGFVAQEALKGVMHKFTPLKQWLYLGVEETIPGVDKILAGDAIDIADFTPPGDRSDAQVICFGKTLCDQLAQLKLFMVGSGAIGCELLKNLAMLNIA